MTSLMGVQKLEILTRVDIESEEELDRPIISAEIDLQNWVNGCLKYSKDSNKNHERLITREYLRQQLQYEYKIRKIAELMEQERMERTKIEIEACQEYFADGFEKIKIFFDTIEANGTTDGTVIYIEECERDERQNEIEKAEGRERKGIYYAEYLEFPSVKKALENRLEAEREQRELMLCAAYSEFYVKIEQEYDSELCEIYHQEREERKKVMLLMLWHLEKEECVDRLAIEDEEESKVYISCAERKSQRVKEGEEEPRGIKERGVADGRDEVGQNNFDSNINGDIFNIDDGLFIADSSNNNEDDNSGNNTIEASYLALTRLFIIYKKEKASHEEKNIETPKVSYGDKKTSCDNVIESDIILFGHVFKQIPLVYPLGIEPLVALTGSDNNFSPSTSKENDDAKQISHLNVRNNEKNVDDINVNNINNDNNKDSSSLIDPRLENSQESVKSDNKKIIDNKDINGTLDKVLSKDLLIDDEKLESLRKEVEEKWSKILN